MRISVALCTYNGAAYIQQQLQSILAQTVPVDEIVISDDGSSDNTLILAENILCKSNISYQIVKNQGAKGVVNNFLNALRITTGDYCFTCDQDDIWFEDKVAVFLSALEQSKKDLYFSDGILADKSGAPLGGNLWETCGFSFDAFAPDAFVFHLLKSPVVTGAAMMVSRKLIDAVSQIPAPLLHDEWLALLAAKAHSAVPINAPTFYYRQHGKNVVGAKKLTLKEKAIIWFGNIQVLTQMREKGLQRILAIQAALADNEYESRAKQAAAFWRKLNQLQGKRKGKELAVITKLLRSGEYAAFYTGLRGYLRDSLWILFCKK